MRAEPTKLPPWWRVLLAFAAAPTVAALALACVDPLYGGEPSFAERIHYSFPPFVVIGGYAPTLLFGIPLYLLLRRRIRPTYLACAVAGAAVAGLPWIVVAFRPVAEDGSFGYGSWDTLRVAAEGGVFGTFGGLVFRLVAGAGRARIRSARET